MRVADLIQCEELLDEPPRLRVKVRVVLEPGFSFIEQHLGVTNGTEMLFDHPENAAV